ncbi:MAG: peptidoglycan-binding protein [Proteobacteria bacterium]|nr:peptidoglycan-binding protein [Pseudomonadota bacterium]
MHPDPFGRVLAAPKTEPEIMNFNNPFRIQDSVGTEGRNGRRDVAKVESLLGRAGDLNLDETDGVTGFVGLRMDEAIRRFQKRNRLRVDGQINPGGETLTTLGATLAAEPESDADTNDGSDRPPDRKEPVLPKRPFETRDRMESIPTVPGTLDNNEIIIQDPDGNLRLPKKRRERRA